MELVVNIQTMGMALITVNGQPVNPGKLPCKLLVFMADHARHGKEHTLHNCGSFVTRKQIFQALWPDLSTKEATNVFHVSKRQFNSAILSQARAMAIPVGEIDNLFEYVQKMYVLADRIYNGASEKEWINLRVTTDTQILEAWAEYAQHLEDLSYSDPEHKNDHLARAEYAWQQVVALYGKFMPGQEVDADEDPRRNKWLLDRRIELELIMLEAKYRLTRLQAAA